MDKKEIIGIVNAAMNDEIRKEVIKTEDKQGIGCNQFRELAH